MSRSPASTRVRNEFASAREALALALDQERAVTEQIAALAAAARDEDDYLGEQFMQWFLKEQVEEVAAMTTLLRIADRAGDQPVRPRGLRRPRDAPGPPTPAPPQWPAAP